METKSIAPKLRNWTRWGLIISGVAAVAVAGVFATRVQGAEQPSTTHKGTAAVAVKTAMVSEGRVEASLAYTGDVKATAQVAVLPKGTGRIERLLVDVGSQVKKGDVIAELEAASLKAQVSQAQANLAAAQAKLASMESGPRAEQVAQARANLDSARARLASMQEGRGEQIAQAQAALEIAWANREKVRKGATEADRQAAQSAVDSALANLQTARARLEQVKQGPTQAEWGQALGAVDSARANLAAAEARLADAKAGPKEDALKAAEAAVVAAKAQVAAAEDLKELVGTQSGLAAGATSGEKVDRQAAAAQAQLEAAQAKLELLRQSPLPAELEQLQAAVDGARAGLMAAEYRVDQMKRGATREELQQAEAGVLAAEAALASSQARVKQIEGGATDEELWVVESAVRQAEQAVALAQKPYREEDLAQARAGVVAAEQGYLLAQNPYTEHDMAMARATVRQAEAALEMAEIALGEMVVVSPVDGVVADRLLSVGALVSPQTPIVSLVSREVELVLGVEESQIGQVREGQKAEITVAAYPDVTFPAEVAVISPVADPMSRTFQVKVRPEDPEGKLRPGMFAQVKIVAQEREQAVLVPKEAVVKRGGQTAVFVLKGDAVQLRPVKLGIGGNGTTEIVSGLVAGEEVVVAGHGELRDGDLARKS